MARGKVIGTIRMEGNVVYFCGKFLSEKEREFAVGLKSDYFQKSFIDFLEKAEDARILECGKRSKRKKWS